MKLGRVSSYHFSVPLIFVSYHILYYFLEQSKPLIFPTVYIKQLFGLLKISKTVQLTNPWRAHSSDILWRSREDSFLPH